MSSERAVRATGDASGAAGTGEAVETGGGETEDGGETGASGTGGGEIEHSGPRHGGETGHGGRTLREVGEFGLIDRIARQALQGERVLLGPGDDAAVLAAPDGRVVASTDLLLQGRHFRTDWSTAYQVGRKAAAQNLADIAAMGAAPTGLLVGLAAPADLPLDWAERLAEGLADEGALVGVSVAGGDTTRGDSIMIAVTALGDLGGRAPVTRAGAHPGDKVAVAGELGWSVCGYELLRRGVAATGPQKALARHRSPQPPYAQGPVAALAGATAMIDVSDGLLADLGHIARESDVGIDVEPGAFAIPDELAEAAHRLDVDVLTWILTGGEDHALAACFPAAADIPQGWSVIGTVLKRSADSSAPRVTVAGAAWAGPQGWDHFA